ncbi:MAG TPA: SDR family oxidoreductase [Solirubrobacteraceae bacterium]|nr:SDR family oxidoreductase [Solirubrobacteraceae bacterium]
MAAGTEILPRRSSLEVTGRPISYFVTGATGFIGRHLVETLLRRDGLVHVLVREGSVGRLDQLIEQWDAGGRIRPVIGDLRKPLLGLGDADVDALRGRIDHFFHVAAIYDMTAAPAHNELVNIGGTRQAVELANTVGAGIFHHVSSIAVAGRYEGFFREDMFDEGQYLPSSYHQTKFDSEQVVRTESAIPWRVYRPSVVIGHSETGVADKIDGPYYFFKGIQKIRRWIPEWVPLVGPEFGHTNIVPVDYVVRAIDHIGHQPGLDGRAFHLTSPKSQRSGEVLNIFAAAAHAPRLAVRIDKRLTDALPKGVFSLLVKLPAIKDIRSLLLADLGIPEEVLGHLAFSCPFDDRDAVQALAGSGIAAPLLETYAKPIWDYWERQLDPDLYKDKSMRTALGGRTVLITGASSGIGRATALMVAAAGGTPLLVARTQNKLDDVRAEIQAAGGTAYVYAADLSDMDAIDGVVDRALADHPTIDFLVNNAGRSIRRSVTLSRDRFHDYERTMQLNYFGAIKLITALMPQMKAQGHGHIVNVSSIGVQTNPPHFSAYVASKAALDAFTRVASSEVIGDGITFTTIHMPLVRTPMIAPTKMYDAFPAISPEAAAGMICEAMRAKPKHVGTKLGTFGEVAYALVPKAVDQVLHLAYRVFPDSAAARGQKDANEHATAEQLALASVMKGVHW